MDPFFVKAIQLLLSLSILIVLHELGHFIPAKIFKTRVEKFYLFFDVKFSLFKKKIGETVYGIGWLPLGGYVKIAGMIDESMDKEQMAQPPKPWEFRSKPAWQRLIIMLGGVTVNIIVGFVIYIFIVFFNGTTYATAESMPDGFAVHETFKELGFEDGDQILKINGKPLEDVREINKYLFLRDVKNIEVLRQDGSTHSLDVPNNIAQQMFEEGVLQPFTPISKPVLDSVVANTPADRAGLKKGDKILAVNDQPITYWHEIGKEMQSLSETQTIIQFERSGNIFNTEITPDNNGTIGVYVFTGGVLHREYTLWESISRGTRYGYETLTDYIAQFKYVFTKKGATQVGGFGAIGNLFPDTWDWLKFWHNTAFISIILAFMNILPIPALDGGHVMFLMYEIVTGRKPNDKVMEYAQMVGFFILIALLLFANGNDIYRWLFN
jgi:regulator of sigma E protease